jgi:hypothetical protein
MQHFLDEQGNFPKQMPREAGGRANLSNFKIPILILKIKCGYICTKEEYKLYTNYILSY